MIEEPENPMPIEDVAEPVELSDNAAAGERPPPDGAADDDQQTDCPITPLGHAAGVYYFLSRSGEVREAKSRDLNGPGLDDLFEGEVQYLYDTFPTTNNEGKVTGYNASSARRSLIRRCVKAGIFDSAVTRRGRGVWSDGTGGLIVHCGDRLRVGDEWRPVGMVRDGAIYSAAPRITAPAAEPAPVGVGRDMRAALDLWRFREPIAADAICGFIGQGLLGAAPEWRGHLYTVAPYGAGKTWLAEFVAAGLGAQAHPLQNNFTEAGLRQAMTGEARALLLDEAEHDEGNRRVRAVIELIRHMSGGAGARVLRGTAGGRSQGFTLTGAAYLSSVLTGGLKPQDRSRITVIHLNPLPTGPHATVARDKVRAATLTLKETSPALWARAIVGWGRFVETLAAWRETFVAAGLSPRDADQISVFAAGRDLLLQDDVPEPGAMVDECDDWLQIAGHAADDDDLEGEGIECVQHILTSPVDAWRSGERRTVAELYLEATKTGGVDERRALQAMGLRVVNETDPDLRCLMVANRHVGLERIFRDTRWAGQGWVDALRHLPGVDAADEPVRFTGTRCRATQVIQRYLPREE